MVMGTRRNRRGFGKGANEAWSSWERKKEKLRWGLSRGKDRNGGGSSKNEQNGKKRFSGPR